jgi:CRP-like cAMP-binding protein
MNKALTYMLADNNIKMSNKVEILAERGLRDRIMVYLNVLRVKSGSDTVTIKMSREQLAQYLCVNRSALSNELSKMKRDGLIDFKGTRFTILDKK